MSTNALNAFLLNVAAVFLISASGGLVLTLAGVFKVGRFGYTWREFANRLLRVTFSQDILLITASTVFFGSSITVTQVVGE
jgi:hypothetical protein